MLRELAKDIWVRGQPLKLLGMKLGTRMTVVRITDSSLWLHSPVKLEDSLKLDSGGRVAFLVAPVSHDVREFVAATFVPNAKRRCEHASFQGID